MRNVSLMLGLLSLSFPFTSFSQDKNYPCSGAPGEFRVNPDDSLGGFVWTLQEFEFLNNRLKVSPRSQKSFDDKIILWRIQDKEGFLDFNAHIDYGHWLGNKVDYSIKNMTSLNGSDVYWIYVTVGDTKTGQCLQHEVKVRVLDNKLSFIQE